MLIRKNPLAIIAVALLITFCGSICAFADDMVANSWRFTNGQYTEPQQEEQFSAPIRQKRSLLASPAFVTPEQAIGRGIDVSEWNGTINWAQVKSSGQVDFAIIRAAAWSERKDYTWDRNISEAQKYGIPVGAYIYSYAKTTQAAKDEADAILRIVGGRKLDLPIYLDLEDNSTIGANFAAIAEAFCTRIEQAGYQAGVYANKYWWSTYLTDPIFNQWDKWVAQYNRYCDYNGTYQIWQQSSTTGVAGISGNVDYNYLIHPYSPAKTDLGPIKYSSYTSAYGWQYDTYNGGESGSTGHSRALLGFKASLLSGVSGNIQYRVYNKNTGWSYPASNNNSAGTLNSTTPIQAISITLSGNVQEQFNVFYRAHVSGIGWMGWSSNGAPAGYIDSTHQVESIQIMLLEKNQQAPGSTSGSYIGPVFDTLRYQAHVANLGWLPEVGNNQVAGTTGKSLSLQALVLSKPASFDSQSDIQIAAHVSTIGWQNFVSSGNIAGTTGRNLPIEAVRIKLIGNAQSQYDIYYRVHSADYGWLGWAKNGEDAGTVGISTQAEAIQIQLVKKGDPTPSVSDQKPCIYEKTTLTYAAHVRNIGWQATVNEGVIAGTVGKSLPVEALKVNIKSTSYSGDILGEAHVQNIGWIQASNASNGIGTTGKALRLEAVKLYLTGELANKYDLYYKVHVSELGWLGWTKNGSPAGTTGKSLAIEAIQIKLVEKGTAGESLGTSYYGA